MRITYKVVGIETRSGIGKKSGKPYNFTNLHVVVDSDPTSFVKGQAVETISLPDDFPETSVQLNGKYVSDYYRDNNYRTRIVTLNPMR